jgi:hypothetical protein
MNCENPYFGLIVLVVSSADFSQMSGPAQILVRYKKSKLIHFKSEKNKTSTESFLKYNISIVALFESYLLKFNRHNYKQRNTRNMKKLDPNN